MSSNAYEFPPDLIRQLQISTRSAAGLSDYDPEDPTLPPLPSIASIVGSSEPSPRHLRCNSCKGKLLRGTESFICVYCGRQTDFVHDPISFNSTVGYQWLLKSLNLDGSEIVGPPLEKDGQKRGQSSTKDEIRLSDFLNFKISWPLELEKPDSSAADDKVGESKKSWSSIGVDLDYFFAGSNLNIPDVSAEQQVTFQQAKTLQSKEVAALDNPSLFENASEPAGSLYGINNDDALNGWEADFQFASSVNQPGISKSSDIFIGSSVHSGDQNGDSKASDSFGGSFDPFANSSVDLSAHIDSVFGPGNDSKDKQLKNSSEASFGGAQWTSDDLSNNVSSNESQVVGVLDAIVGVNDAHNSGNINTPSNVNRFQDYEQQIERSDRKTVNGDEDPFDEWNDFTTSSSTQGAAKTEVKDQNQSSHEKTAEIDLFSSENKLEEWNALSSLTNTLDPSDNAWTQGTDQRNSYHGKTSEIDLFSSDNKLEYWDDFMSSTSIKDPLKNTSTQSNNHNESSHTKVSDMDLFSSNNQFDEWNAFASSTTTQDPFKNVSSQVDNQNDVSHVKTSGIDLFSSDGKFEEADFGSFAQPALTHSSSNKASFSANAIDIFSEAPDLDRIAGTSMHHQENADQVGKNADVSENSTKLKDDVDMLISQMHDLSFMLKDELSVPSRSHNSSSSS